LSTSKYRRYCPGGAQAEGRSLVQCPWQCAAPAFSWLLWELPLIIGRAGPRALLFGSASWRSFQGPGEAEPRCRHCDSQGSCRRSASPTEPQSQGSLSAHPRPATANALRASFHFPLGQYVPFLPLPATVEPNLNRRFPSVGCHHTQKRTGPRSTMFVASSIPRPLAFQPARRRVRRPRARPGPVDLGPAVTVAAQHRGAWPLGSLGMGGHGAPAARGRASCHRLNSRRISRCQWLRRHGGPRLAVMPQRGT
jgi:hypothetical protein